MFVLAINGTYEPYTPRLLNPSPRVRAGQSIDRAAGDDHTPPLPLDQVAVAARTAYVRTQEDSSGRKPVLLAQDIMKAPVIAISPDTSLAEAWGLMRTNSFRHIPVVSTGHVLVGIVSDRDLLRYANVLDRSEQAPLPDRVRQIMTSKVLVATATTEVREISQVMLHERISAMPIIDESNRPVGILTVTDILRAIVNRAPLELWS